MKKKKLCLKIIFKWHYNNKVIELEDAIDLREIKNIKLANQLLKIRRNKSKKKINIATAKYSSTS